MMGWLLGRWSCLHRFKDVQPEAAGANAMRDPPPSALPSPPMREYIDGVDSDDDEMAAIGLPASHLETLGPGKFDGDSHLKASLGDAGLVISDSGWLGTQSSGRLGEQRSNGLPSDDSFSNKQLRNELAAEARWLR